MPNYDAKVNAQTPIAQGQSRAMTTRENMAMLPVTLVDFTQDANVSRPPDYHIYVYNIAPRRFEIRRPPNFPCLVFAACPKGKPYAKVGVFPNIVNEKWVDADTGETRVRGIIGERFVMDLLNPVCLGVDMWQPRIEDDRSWNDANGTDDMTRRGLFFSTDDPPTQEQLDITKQRMENHYRALLQQADEAFMTNDRDARRTIGREHHDAAEYFHAKSQWHIVAEMQATCPNCGEIVAPGVAYHRNSMGDKCIIDRARAIAAGVLQESKK